MQPVRRRASIVTTIIVCARYATVQKSMLVAHARIVRVGVGIFQVYEYLYDSVDKLIVNASDVIPMQTDIYELSASNVA